MTSNGGGTNNTSNNSTGLVQSLEGGVVTKRSSRIAGLSKKEESKLRSVLSCLTTRMCRCSGGDY